MRSNQFFTVQRRQDVMIVHLTMPRITADWVIEKVYTDLAHTVWKHRPICVLVNFGRVVALSSTLVGKLRELGDRQRRRGGWLKLCGLAPTLREPFELSPKRTFDICESARHALRA